jgi:TPR repeat protein
MMDKEEERAALEAKYRPTAEQGDAEAQFKLGKMYFHNSSFRKDEQVANWVEAEKWFRKAADQGHAEAQFYMGRICWFGIGLPAKKPDESKAWYTKAAEQAHIPSMLALGWNREVAELGYAEAQYELGKQYEGGAGVPLDDGEAMAWYLKAANNTKMYSEHILDHPSRKAAYAIAKMYEEGRGVPKNDETALAWIIKAAEMGDSEAPWDIANRYAKGIGVPKDTAVAAEWYVEAESRGQDFDWDDLKKICKARGLTLQEMLAAYRKAAETCDAWAAYLADLYEYGYGAVSPDKAESQKWRRKAAAGFSGHLADVETEGGAH